MDKKKSKKIAFYLKIVFIKLLIQKLGSFFITKDKEYVSLLFSKVNTVNLIPYITKKFEETNSNRKIIAKFNRIKNDFKIAGEGFYKASDSMSENGATIYYTIASNLNNVNFYIDGFIALTEDGYLSQAGIEKEDIAKYINHYINKLRFNGKRLPFCYLIGGNVFIPNLMIKKKKENISDEKLN